MAKPFLQRLRAKEYAGSWKNPLFADPKVRERTSERLRYVLYTLLVLVSFAACVSLLFWFGVQDRFAISEVRASGMRSVSNQVLARDALYELTACRHLFAPCLYTWNVGKGGVVAVLSGAYTLEQIATSVEEHALVLQVREAVTLIPLRINSAVWFATQSGVLQMEATADDIAAGVLIPPEAYSEIDVSATVKEAPVVGMEVLSAERFAQIAAYRKEFTSHGIAITSFTVTEDAGKVIATTGQGFAVFFTPWEDAEVQVGRMSDVLKEATPQSYVDIRFGERIYVK